MLQEFFFKLQFVSCCDTSWWAIILDCCSWRSLISVDRFQILFGRDVVCADTSWTLSKTFFNNSIGWTVMQLKTNLKSISRWNCFYFKNESQLNTHTMFVTSSTKFFLTQDEAVSIYEPMHKERTSTFK